MKIPFDQIQDLAELKGWKAYAGEGPEYLEDQMNEIWDQAETELKAEALIQIKAAIPVCAKDEYLEECAQIIMKGSDEELEETVPDELHVWVYDWEGKRDGNKWVFKNHWLDDKHNIEGFDLLKCLKRCDEQQQDAKMLAEIFANRLSLQNDRRKELIEIVTCAYNEGVKDGSN